MDINSFTIYSVVSTNETKSEEDMIKILALTKKLPEFNQASTVKLWLKENWGINNDVDNLAVSQNVLLSAKTGSKYFNVTVKYENKVDSYNYTLKE